MYESLQVLRALLPFASQPIDLIPVERVDFGFQRVGAPSTWVVARIMKVPDATVPKPLFIELPLDRYYANMAGDSPFMRKEMDTRPRSAAFRSGPGGQTALIRSTDEFRWEQLIRLYTYEL